MIVIIGAGLAGLAAARRLVQAGCEDFLVVEKSDRAGGRVQTATVHGYRLDAGFHVASDAYRAFRSFLPASKLEPAWFDSGVLLQASDGNLVPLYHPLRHPRRAWRSGWPPFSPADLFRLVRLAVECLARPSDVWRRRNRVTTAELLVERRLSEEMVDAFLRPFFGGVFLDADLETSAGLFRYYLRHFILGRAFVPAGGIGRLAAALRRDIPEDRFRFRTEVRQIEPGADGIRLPLGCGENLDASRVIVACDPVEASRLLGWPVPETRSTATVYFQGQRPLYEEKCLVLPRARQPLVRHFVQITNIDPCLAPPGRHLLSATVLDDRGWDDGRLCHVALEEIEAIFPGASGVLVPLQVVRVPAALPVQNPRNLTAWRQRTENLGPGIFLAGDLAGNASQQNAMESGVDGAEAALSFRRDVPGSPEPSP